MRLQNKTGRLDEKNLFIEMRAGGQSYAVIAKKLSVSKSTLSVWESELEKEISELKAIRLGELYEKYSMLKTSRIQQLGETLQKINKEIAERDFSDLSLERLLHYKLQYMEQLKAEVVDSEYKTPINVNAEGVIQQLLSVLSRLRSGDITREQAVMEANLLTRTLQAYDSHTLEKKLDQLKATLESNR